jgi:peptidoglycan/LPS O-acetylase OafA/YrhL
VSRRLENLDALRGTAAITVMFQHLLGHIWRTMPNDEVAWLKAVGLNYFDWGRFGVVLFFLISGYVIPLSFRGPTPIAKFAVSRAFRLYPAFWISVIFTTMLLVIAGTAPSSRQFLANVTMAYPAFRQPALSGVYWTLIVELLFYFTAIVLFVANSLERPLVLGWVALLAICSAVIPMSTSVITEIHLPMTLLGYHLSFLLLGCLIRLSLAQALHAKTMALLVGAALAASLPLVSGLFTGDFGKPTNYSMAYPIGAMLAVAAAVAIFMLFWLPPFRRQSLVAVSLGAWSFSIYLFHEPIATIITWICEPNTATKAITFFISVSVVTIVVSALVYSFVEKPCIRFGQNLVPGTPPKEATEIAP